MTDKDTFQQQILFAEKEVEITVEDKQPAQQLFVENEHWQPVEVEQDIARTNQEQSKKRNWLMTLFLTTMTGVVGIELVDFFTLGFANEPITTSLYGLLLLCVGLLSGSSLLREISGLRQLKARDKLRQDISAVDSQSDHQYIESLCESITESLPCDLSSQQLEKWQESKVNELTNEELMQLYSRLVLTQVDQKALAEVAKYSSESVVLIALSPLALLDMLIMLWRNLTMVDKVAGLYGLKLGYWSRIKLVKQVFMNMIYAGASEVVTDVSVDMLGADLLGKLSGRLAQGLGAGMLTARLGLRTIYLCRPMPFDEHAPKLSQVRKEVIQQIKQLLPRK